MIHSQLQYGLIVQAILLAIPEYVANGSPPVISKIVKNTHPIDFGKNFIDNKRLFGDGKTFEGFVGGILAGYSISLIIYTLIILLYPSIIKYYVIPGPTDILILCTLALTGDLIGAFIKRRLGLPRGAPAPLLDQLDFMALPFVYMYYVLNIDNIMIYIFLIILTVGMHYFTNFVAYKLKIKREPW